MNIDEYTQCDGIRLAQLIRDGEVTADEVAQAACDTIARDNGPLNAVIAMTPEEQRAALARDADSPLAGVPFLLKDVGLPFAGIPNECGSRLAQGLVPEEDSALARRIKAAGLVTVGRSNTPEFGINVTTETRATGTAHNPWHRDYSPGGSSGGAAAAVATGLVPVAHANDGGGSIRIPAHCCGLVGFKPSRGLISWAPQMDESFFGMGSQLVVTRTVRDSAAAFDIMTGREPGDRFIAQQRPSTLLEAAQDPPPPLKIAFWTRAPLGGPAIDSDYVAALQDLATHLGTLGHRVIEVEPAVEHAVSGDLFCNINAAAGASLIGGLAQLVNRAINSDTVERCTQLWWEHGSRMSTGDLMAALDRLNTVTRKMGALFQEYDVLLSPVGVADAPRLGLMNQDGDWKNAQDWSDYLFSFYPFPALFNITGQPACSIPAGLSPRGLPWGAHLAADMGREDLLFRLATQIERERPWPLLAKTL